MGKPGLPLLILHNRHILTRKRILLAPIGRNAMFKPKLRASVRCAAILGVGLALMLESLQIAKGDVVVSTLANSVVGQDSTPTTNAAQGFTTGNQAETLQSVTLEFTGSVGDAPEVISLFIVTALTALDLSSAPWVRSPQALRAPQNIHW
jgi:hypothetical protein